MLMQRFGLSAEKAFGVLRRYLQQHNVTLAAAAEQFTTTRTLPGPRKARAGPGGGRG